MVYPKTMDARLTLLTSGIILKRHTIPPRDKNPFIVRMGNGEERETPSTKLLIGTDR